MSKFNPSRVTIGSFSSIRGDKPVAFNSRKISEAKLHAKCNPTLRVYEVTCAAMGACVREWIFLA